MSTRIHRPRRRSRLRVREQSTSDGAGSTEGQAPAARLFDRLMFLSDGVFIIVMTLLVVELVVPSVISSEPSALVDALLPLRPKYLKELSTAVATSAR